MGWLWLSQEFLDACDRAADRLLQFGSQLHWFDATLFWVAQLAPHVQSSLAQTQEIVAELETLRVLGTRRTLDLPDHQGLVLVSIGGATSQHVDFHSGQG